MTGPANSSAPPIRAFIAAWISDPARVALVETTSRLRQIIPDGVQWVRPEGIHLTLKFLGNFRSDLAEGLLAGLKGPAQESLPFQVGLAVSRY